MQSEKFDCVIIGGGVGGLTAGAYLSKAGLKTLLLERHEATGGVAGTFFLNGYRFEIGGSPQYDQIAMLKELGVHELVEFVPMGDPAIAMHFPDYTIYGPKVMYEFLKQFQGICTTKELQEFREMLSSFISINMEKYFRLNQLLSESKIRFLLGLLKSNPFELLKVFNLMTQNSVKWLNARVTNREVFETISFINGLTFWYPCVRMPALLTVLIMSGLTEKLGGRWHLVKGGNINYSLALGKAIERHGGIIKTKKEVKKILIHNGEAKGVVLEDGEEIIGKYIISDIGIKETIKYLVGVEHFEERYVRKIESLKPTPSLLKIYLGLKKKPDLKAVINFKVCDLNESAWWETIEQGYLPEKPPLLFYCKSPVDPSMAPEGRYDIDILVPAPFKHRDGDWDGVKKKERDKIISVMEEVIPDISSQIDFEWVFTPKDFGAYSGQEGGGVLPVEPSVEQLMKFPDMDLPIKNLYCVGGTVKGGAGINGAANTGKLCAQKIIHQLITG